MSTQDWQERRYREAFEETCARMGARRETDPGFTREHLEELLESAYVDHGNDWLGRGAVANTTQSAAIAAYEHLLAEWKAEGPDRRPMRTAANAGRAGVPADADHRAE